MEMEGTGQSEEDQKQREAGRRKDTVRKVGRVFWVGSTCFEVNRKNWGTKEEME